MTKDQKGKAKPAAPKAADVASLTARVDKLSRMLPKGTFAKAGTAIGAMAGPKGAIIGNLAGRGLAAITGRGDYEIESNTLGTISTSVDELPQFVKNKHTVGITHREYVGDIVVPSIPILYNNNTYVLNPGNGSLFPWLAQMAKQYQQYKIRGMVIEYKSNTSDYAASGPLGIVGIAANYNVNEVKFPNLVAFENSEYAVVSKPSRSMIHAIECAPKTGRDDFLFVRDPASIDNTATSDNRFYDYALVQVATSGLPGAPGTLLGQLFVSYDIEFTKPVISPSASVPTLIPGVVVNSNASGTIAVSPSAVQASVEYISPTFSPGAGTVNGYVNLSSPTVSGDVGLDGTVVSNRSSTEFRLNRPGYYRFIYTMYANTVASTRYALGSTTDIDGTGSVTYTGTASGSAGIAWDNAPQVAHACLVATTATGGYRHTTTGTLLVSAADSTNHVVITCPTFKASPTSLVLDVTRSLTVQWLSTAPANVAQ